MPLYAAKKVDVVKGTPGGALTKIATSGIWIGKSDYTNSEIATKWGTLTPRPFPIENYYSAMNGYIPFDYTGFPSFHLGRSASEADYIEAKSVLGTMDPYSAEIEYTYNSEDGWIGLVDSVSTGNGIFINPGHNMGAQLVLDGVTYGSDGTLPYPIWGVWKEGNYGCTILYITADDIAVIAKYWLNTFNGAATSFRSADNQKVLDWIASLPDTEINSDPYEDGVGESIGGIGGDGTFDFSSTAIAPPGVPNIGAMDTGMINIYVPSASDLRGLAHYLWAGAFDVDSFKRVFLDPMDVIIGLHIVPVTAAQIGTTSATLMVGNISSGLSMPKANSQYVQIDFGTVNILPKWGAYLDFSPYSKLQLFLPYIGYVDISPDDCMNGSINVKYTIDILGGTCVAHVTCVDGTTPGGHMLYEFSASCACEVPVTSGQYQNIAFSVLNVGTSIARAVMGGFAQNATHAVSSIAESVQNAIKPEITRSGGFGASAGLMGGQIPYLILTIPRMCIPGQQNTYIGYPSFVTKMMEDLIGYASINVTHLENMSCTDEEANEIIALLKQGVIW